MAKDLMQLAVEDNVKDPSWAHAQDITAYFLKIPGPLLNIIRNSWSGILKPDEFVKYLGFTGLNPSCLLDAAEIPIDGQAANADSVHQAVHTLGVRFAAFVLATNVTVRTVLKGRPPIGSGWKELLQTTATDMEIGYKLGLRLETIGFEGGMILGFARYAGLGLLSIAHKDSYKIWKREFQRQGYVDRDLELQLFGCEPYQVSALVLQTLGLGTEIAFGSAIALGRLDPKHLQVEPNVMKWKSCYEWLLALKEGRNYPGDLEIRNFFPKIVPPKDRNQKNTVLEVLYTEVAKIRRDGSRWTWHLPKPGYDLTQEAFGLN